MEKSTVWSDHNTNQILNNFKVFSTIFNLSNKLEV